MPNPSIIVAIVDCPYKIKAQRIASCLFAVCSDIHTFHHLPAPIVNLHSAGHRMFLDWKWVRHHLGIAEKKATKPPKAVLSACESSPLALQKQPFGVVKAALWRCESRPFADQRRPFRPTLTAPYLFCFCSFLFCFLPFYPFTFLLFLFAFKENAAFILKCRLFELPLRRSSGAPLAHGSIV